MMMTMNRNEEIDRIHQGALLLADPEQMRTMSKEEEVVLVEQARLEEDEVSYAKERETMNNYIRGEAFRFAEAARHTDIMGDIKKSNKEKKTFWSRFKVLLGWGS